MTPHGIRITNSKATKPQAEIRIMFLTFGLKSLIKLLAKKNGMYVVNKTGMTPHHLYTQMNDQFVVPAKNDSNKANNRAIEPVVINLRASVLFSFSFGIIFQEIIPANENIIDNSQLTPMRRMNVVESLDPRSVK